MEEGNWRREEGNWRREEGNWRREEEQRGEKGVEGEKTRVKKEGVGRGGGEEWKKAGEYNQVQTRLSARPHCMYEKFGLGMRLLAS